VYTAPTGLGFFGFGLGFWTPAEAPVAPSTPVRATHASASHDLLVR
jgi:hypothetical protein